MVKRRRGVWKPAKKTVHFAVAREPIDRFVSGYMHICAGPESCDGLNIHNFTKAIYKAFDQTPPRWQNPQQSFRILHHFAPQTWYCAPEKVRFKYSPKSGKMASEFRKIMDEARVPRQHQKKILRRIRDQPINTSNSTEAQRRALRAEIFGHCETLQKIVGLYYEDYIKLKYRIPTGLPKKKQLKRVVIDLKDGIVEKQILRKPEAPKIPVKLSKGEKLKQKWVGKAKMHPKIMRIFGKLNKKRQQRNWTQKPKIRAWWRRHLRK